MSESKPLLRIGLVGAGMIVDETYLPAFRNFRRTPLYRRSTGAVEIVLAGLASRTGERARRTLTEHGAELGNFSTPCGPNALAELLAAGVDAVCVATPDDRHFEFAKAALEAGKHVLIEKPSVLRCSELATLQQLARRHGVLAKVVYHKLLDPDHKKLRTLVEGGVLKHVNHGYCSLLEPKSIATGQFGEWLRGRNPGTYVAVHYVKLIDFTFGGELVEVHAAGQRGIVGPADGDTWDSTQLRLVYRYSSGRTAAFDLHTSWVTPDNFPGYVEQEVQFRFDNGVWHGHSRKRGVELTVEGETPTLRKSTLNNHYNGKFLEPWGERSQRGYGIEAVARFFEEVAEAEFGGPPDSRGVRVLALRNLAHNDLSADGQTVAAVEALEAILAERVAGRIAHAALDAGQLLLWRQGETVPVRLSSDRATNGAAAKSV